MRFTNNQFKNMSPLDRMYSSLPVHVPDNGLSKSYFVEKKKFRVKSIENRYRVSFSFLLFKKCRPTVIGTVVTVFAKYRYRGYF